MKKNITINLAGQLFNIDEDAYELLLNYTETLRRFYRRQAEGEEVVDDIEARIAELMAELKPQGYHAVTIEHVQNIIQRIGRLEDLTEEVTPDESTTGSNTDDQQEPLHTDQPRGAAGTVRDAWNKLRSGKRFYRDTENKMLFGVLAGCAKYFGGDTVIWRLVFLLLILVPIPFLDELHGITGTLAIIYIILAVIAPATATPEDVLKMRGEEVTPQKLAEEVTRQNTEASANVARAQRRHTISVICAVILIIFSVWMWIGLLGVLCGAGALWMMPDFITDEMISYRSNVPADTVSNLVFSIIYILISVAFCLFTLGYSSMHTGLTLLDKVKAMGLKERIVWLVIFVFSVIAIVMTSVNCAARFNSFEQKYPHDWEKEMTYTPSDDTAATLDTICAESDTALTVNEAMLQENK